MRKPADLRIAFQSRGCYEAPVGQYSGHPTGGELMVKPTTTRHVVRRFPFGCGLGPCPVSALLEAWRWAKMLTLW